MSAPFFDHGQIDEGIVVLYLGGPDGLSSAPAWLGESNQAAPGCRYGHCIGYARIGSGDTDGDGLSDLVLGAGGTANGGTAWVYRGVPR